MNNEKSPIAEFFIRTLVAIFILYTFVYLLGDSINVSDVADKAEQFIKTAITKTNAKIW